MRAELGIAPIPGYTLVRKIAEGGVGLVYLARQDQTQQLVAIKIFKPVVHPAWIDPTHSRVLAEFRRLEQFDHPNVIRVFGWMVVDGKPMLVMEWLDGSSLRSRMRANQPGSLRTIVPIVDGVAQALIYIHERKLLHLDLKPENVLIDKADGVKVTDFGLSLTMADGLGFQDPDGIPVSIDYCSPEQRHGLGVDERSDLFSLATMVYEMLTGVLPGRAYTPCREYNPSVPASVDESLRQALSRNRSERQGSVAQFRAEFLKAAQKDCLPESRDRMAGGSTIAFLLALVVSLGAIATMGRLEPLFRPERGGEGGESLTAGVGLANRTQPFELSGGSPPAEEAFVSQLASATIGEFKLASHGWLP